MAKVSYSSLKLKLNNNVKTFNFNGSEIEVLQYLAVEDKYDLVMITLQNSLEDGIYNPVKMDLFFHLYLVYLYTNISFTDKQKEDPYKIFNMLKSNGLLDLVLSNINEEEYTTLFKFLEEVSKVKTEYNRSAIGLLQSVIHDLPTQANAMKEIMDNFDPNKFQNVIEFAKAANGGRDI